MSDFQSAFDAKFTLFDVKEKKSERAPDKTGSIEIELDQAMKLAEWLTSQPGEGRLRRHHRHQDPRLSLERSVQDRHQLHQRQSVGKEV
jgi:hypothetical protein